MKANRHVNLNNREWVDRSVLYGVWSDGFFVNELEGCRGLDRIYHL